MCFGAFEFPDLSYCKFHEFSKNPMTYIKTFYVLISQNSHIYAYETTDNTAVPVYE